MAIWFAYFLQVLAFLISLALAVFLVFCIVLFVGEIQRKDKQDRPHEDDWIP